MEELTVSVEILILKINYLFDILKKCIVLNFSEEYYN